MAGTYSYLTAGKALQHTQKHAERKLQATNTPAYLAGMKKGLIPEINLVKRILE
jgi:hypothetical protein